MAFLFGRSKKRIPSSATFRLTQEGTEKLQEFSGDPKSKVLETLQVRGTSNVDEISQASGLSRGQVERLIPAMLRGGYVQYVGAQSEDME